MKKIAFLLLFPMLVLPGCGGYDQKQSGQEYKYTQVSYKEGNQMANNTAYTGEFGFMRHVKGTAHVKKGNAAPYINRQKLSDIITDLALQTHDVQEAGTLVTDKEVLIGYRTNSKNRSSVADQVKMSAFAIVPRFYHVYVSDEKGIIDKIGQYRSLNNNSADVNGIMNHLIQEMKKSPQGKKWNYGENENGEMNGETNQTRSKMTGK